MAKKWLSKPLQLDRSWFLGLGEKLPEKGSYLKLCFVPDLRHLQYETI